MSDVITAVKGVDRQRVGPGSETEAPVKFAAVNLAASADQSVVAAVTGKKIRVLSLDLTGSTGDGTLLFESDEDTDVALTGLIPFDITVPALNRMKWESKHGLFETNAGKALTATCATVTVDGWLTYIEV